MSLRDEMARAAYEGSLPNPIDREYIRFDAGYWGRIADALMPLVERAVREAFRAGVNVGSSPRFDGHAPRESVDTIVARIIEGGR